MAAKFYVQSGDVRFVTLATDPLEAAVKAIVHYLGQNAYICVAPVIWVSEGGFVLRTDKKPRFEGWQIPSQLAIKKAQKELGDV